MNRFKYSFSLYFLILTVLSSNATPVNELSKGITEFANDFYLQCVKEKPGNVIVSPLSVSSALALLSQAAGGDTYDQLKQTLHIGNDKSTVANQFFEHRETLEKSAGESTLSIANGVYVQQGCHLNKNFREVALSKFKSNIESLNFAESAKSAATINHFVQEKTNGKITEIFKPDQLDSNTRSVLVNAVYFKGNWEKPFFETVTSKNGFYNSETEKVQVDFMYVDDDFKSGYIKELDATALELKYANSNMSFVIVLPESRTGLVDLEAKLKDNDLAKIAENLQEDRYELHIPKFKVEYEIELNDVLQKMGITEVFSSTANLSGLLDSAEQLKVSKAVHKAVIEINERGSESAATTGFGIVFTSAPPEFRADHPFMYFIRETTTNTILFSGRIARFD